MKKPINIFDSIPDLPTKDLTVVVMVDQEHLAELQVVLPTWRQWCPWLFQCRWVVIYDAEGPKPRKITRRTRLVPWHWPYSGTPSQREKMLTAWVNFVPYQVQTRWWLKIDTDVIFYEDWGIGYNPQGKPWVFSAPGWGYTKPADALQRIYQWCQLWRPDLAVKEPPRPKPGAKRVRHSRIIGSIFLADTAWTRRVADIFSHGPLPFPSQDTLHWYCAWQWDEHFVVWPRGWVPVRHGRRHVQRLLVESN